MALRVTGSETRISKVEAAERQLDAAIRLFFAEEDWIAVHTLAAASSRILRDLSEQQGTSAWCRVNEVIVPAKRREFWGPRGVNKAANFLKHADRDPDELLEGIDPLVNDQFILLNCFLFLDLEKRLTPAISVFISWHMGVYPDLFLAQGQSNPIFVMMKDLAASVWDDMSRPQQLAFARMMLQQEEGKAAARAAPSPPPTQSP